MFHVKHEVTHTQISQQALKELNELLSRNQEKLYEYSSQLLWWNQKINLVSRDVSRETVSEHIRHSLLISGSKYFKDANKIIDTGTGGGLPGIPLAICFPEKELILNDIVSKKVMAIKQMAMKLGLKNVTTVADSIENLQIGKEDLIITKHAFKVWELTRFLKGKNWKNIVLLKGENEAVEELDKVEGSAKMSVINLDRVIKDEFYKGKAIVELSRIEDE